MRIVPKWKKVIRLFGKLAITLVFMFSLMVCKAQQQEIGKATDLGFVITADTSWLHKAISRTIPGGLEVTKMYIESVGAYHYLIAEGKYRNFNKTAAMVLKYDIMTRTYYAVNGNGYVTCTSAACSSCSLFKENGRIIGCKCAEKSTISNQCNFNQTENSLFFQNLVRAKMLKK